MRSHPMIGMMLGSMLAGSTDFDDELYGSLGLRPRRMRRSAYFPHIGAKQRGRYARRGWADGAMHKPPPLQQRAAA